MSPKDSQEKSVSLSHDLQNVPFAKSLEKRKEEMRVRGDLPGLALPEQEALLEELAQFPLGKFLIQNRGLNGYWTDYILMHPRKKGVEDVEEKTLEAFFLNRAPTTLATQERLDIFQKVLQEELCDGSVLASVPCGVMSDLLTLDFSGVEGVTLVGSDFDSESIKFARENAKQQRFGGKLLFTECDAWQLELTEPADVLTSNGLNIYEEDDERVTSLYSQFYSQLKPGGLLVTSFLTPPPIVDSDSEWRFDKIEMEALVKQKTIFADILGVALQSFRSSAKTRQQLEDAGFTDIRIIPDRAFIFPTVTARKA